MWDVLKCSFFLQKNQNWFSNKCAILEAAALHRAAETDEMVEYSGKIHIKKNFS